MVEAIFADLREIIFCDPGFPMVRQSRGCSVFADSLRIRVLVDDCFALGPWLKDGRGDPRFEDEPAAQVHTTDLVILVVEGYITLDKAAVHWSVRLFE